jgi:hypothetical protein
LIIEEPELGALAVQVLDPAAKVPQLTVFPVPWVATGLTIPVGRTSEIVAFAPLATVPVLVTVIV